MIKSQIDTLKGKELIVSEHALLRYIERFVGVDTDSLKKDILNQELVTKHRQLGDGKYPIDGSIKAVIKSNVVVSIV
jgi:hypothetical protein